VVLLSVVLPVIVLIAAGAALARYAAVETHTLSRVTIYLLTPSLVFTALVKTDLGAADGQRLVALIVVHFLLLVGLASLTGRLLRLPREERSGLSLALALYNAGNYGLPVALFAFGQEGFRLAAVIFVLSAVLTQSVGVYLASAGRNAPWRAAADVFRLPLIYAAIVGLIIGRAGWSVPEPLWRPLELMGQGAIPMLLIALGVQLTQTRSTTVTPPLGVVAALRLVGSPLLTLALLPVFGLAGLPARVALLSTSMPTAVNAFMLAAQFQTAPGFVASAVFLTTVASFVTVSVIVALVR
jgi:predicted permease